MVNEALATKGLREWEAVSDMHECLTGTVGLHNSLMFSTVNDTEDVVAGVMDLELGVWLGSLPVSGMILGRCGLRVRILCECGFRFS